MGPRAGILVSKDRRAERLALGPLSYWINAFLRASGPIRRINLARQDLEVLEFAERHRIIVYAGLARNATCQSCLEPHSADVVSGPGGRYFYKCLFHDLIEIAEEELALCSFDRERLVEALAQAAGSNPKEIRTYADGRLKRIGFVSSTPGAPDWFFAYADGLEAGNVFDGVANALASAFPRGPGLILTPSFVSLQHPLPSDYRLVLLDELTFGFQDNLCIDNAAAAIRLGRRKKAAGDAGRPSQIEITERIWLAERHKSTWPERRSDQASLIIKLWPHEEAMCPKKGTIENHIREFKT